MEDSVYLGLRIPRKTYDALVELKKKSEDDVSLSAIVRGILRQHFRPTPLKTRARRR